MASNLSKQFLLDEDVVFLNHGSFGACPKPVFQTYQEWQLTLERQPVDFLHPKRNLVKRMEAVRAILSKEFHCSASDLVGVANATAGLNIIAQSLDLQEGDEILTSTHEYAALYKTWDYVASKRGARVVEVAIPLPLQNEEAFYQAIVSGFTEKTKVLFLSHITSETALVFPLKRVLAAARNRGILSIVDGAHGPGQLDLNLAELGADFYVGNCHKWLMAPKSSGFIFAAPDMQGLLNPLVISHGWTSEAKAPNALGAFGNTPFIDGIEMQGTQDPSAWLSVPAAIEFYKDNDWKQVRRECSDLLQQTAQRVAKMTGIEAFSSAEFCAPQMVSMPIPNCDSLALNQELLARYNIEIPAFDWRGQSIVRLSVQGYNSQQHMDILVGALKDLLHL